MLFPCNIVCSCCTRASFTPGKLPHLSFTSLSSSPTKYIWRNLASSGEDEIKLPILWYTWPWTLNVGMKFPSVTFFAPKDVIWKLALYCITLSIKWGCSGWFPNIILLSGSGNDKSGSNWTFPELQHIPADSSFHLSALQNLQVFVIGPRITVLSES